MTSQFITIAFFVIAVVLYLIFLWQERKKIFNYRFYEIRDKLYRLAIEGVIKEDSISFMQLSQMLNITIAYSNKFKLYTFIKAMEEKKLSTPDTNNEFFKDIENQDIEEKSLQKDFLKTLLYC